MKKGKLVAKGFELVIHQPQLKIFRDLHSEKNIIIIDVNNTRRSISLFEW